MEHTTKCVGRHVGLWAIDPFVLERGLDLVRAGKLPQVSETFPHWHAKSSTGEEVATTPAACILLAIPEAKIIRDENHVALYGVDPSGVGILEISGAMVKGSSKLGTDTLQTRRAVRVMAENPEVQSVFMFVDSPGGTVAGTDELARDLRNLNARKPIFAHIEDIGGSAAYYVAAQAKRITATESAEVGSIGAFATLIDASKRAEMEGLKVHVISTGGMKGAGEPGEPITDEQLAYFQGRIDAVGDQFIAAIASGRGISTADAAKLMDGRMYNAKAAKKLGMIDAAGVRMDESFAAARDYAKRKRENKARSTTTARAMVHQIELDLDAPD